MIKFLFYDFEQQNMVDVIKCYGSFPKLLVQTD